MRLTPLLCASIGLLGALLKPSFADDPKGSDRAEPGVVLLRNGNVVEGRAIEVGDRYEISIRSGSLSIPKSDVEFVAPDLDAIYQYRRRSIRLWHVEDHLRLADWCLRYALYDHAARELSDASRIKPTHRGVAAIQRRLDLARRPPAKSSELATAAREASTAEWDSAVGSMPPGTLKTFTSSIMPLLLERCGTSACHGVRSATEFNLLRPMSSRAPGRRLVQRNLLSTLKQIDRLDPQASPILTAPLAPHGSCPTPLFAGRDADHYDRLLAWVRSLCGSESEAKMPGTIDASRQHTLLGQTFSSIRTGVIASRSNTGQRHAETLKELSARAASPLSKLPPLRDGYLPVDAFDPEIFNRSFRTSSRRAKSEAREAPRLGPPSIDP